ncbi:DUF3631 domain-containing protein [Paraburkholderia terrae]|uniref:DUF3631 domain-containing protein n=1 Tax=Paraburkholderia terrae TaxID=311230 RepID=UPI001EE309E2|nr:DUF3631 domain-containing protein [Paraburkholderia terrae]GJH04488.1 hypothetical protein CBA19C8_28045 [Paraburkholderia terrae]
MNNASDKVNLALLDQLHIEQKHLTNEGGTNEHGDEHDCARTANDVPSSPRAEQERLGDTDAQLRQDIADAATAEPRTESIADAYMIERLAALQPLQYDRVRRSEANRLGCKLSTLDGMVRKARSAGATPDGMFDAVQECDEPVDGEALLDEIADTVRSFVRCEMPTVHAVTLWIAMTWLMDIVEVAPIAAITAPEKRCGKSQLLALMGRLSYRPLAASNITPAALFRVIEAWHPTLLIDEADAFMKENEELRGLLNCGHTRDNAFVVRTVGDDHTPKRFIVWGAKAIAGIGQLSETLMDRSITLELRRKLPSETLQKLRHADADIFVTLRSKLAKWTGDRAQDICHARPTAPDGLNDRAADNWEPLLQIADVAGGEWPGRARRAALRLSGDEGNSQSVGSELLSDIQAVFERRGVDRIFMADLLSELLQDEEAPWKTWNRGREMTILQLGKKLKDYGIKSKSVRIGYNSWKGYQIEQFSDAFARYLCSKRDTAPSVTESLSSIDAGLSVSEAQTRDPSDMLAVTAESPSDNACDGVTVETGSVGESNCGAADDAAESEL